MDLLSGVNSTATDSRAESTSIGLVDNKSLQRLKNGSGINIKKMVDDLNNLGDETTDRSVNNISYRAMSGAIKNSANQGRGQYASMYGATQPTVSARKLVDSQNNVHLDNYLAGAEVYFNNLASVYGTVANLADLEVTAQMYDGQNQLSWANQALAEAEFEEEKRHTNVLLDQAEQAQAKAKSSSSSGSSGSSGGSGRSSGGGYYSSSGSSGITQSYIDSQYSNNAPTTTASGGLPKFTTSADSKPSSGVATSTNPKEDTYKYIVEGDYDAGVRIDAVEGPEAPPREEKKKGLFGRKK